MVFGVILTPVYRHYREDARISMCLRNAKSMFDSALIYATEHDDRLPPSHYADDNNMPVLIGNSAITWATLIADGMNARQSFLCPTAEPGDYSLSANFKNTKFPIKNAYGFVAGLSTKQKSQIDAPDSTVLFAETLNSGARESYNPVPFGPQDGFLIGYDNSNTTPDPLVDGQDSRSKFVTRLAFEKSKTGPYGSASIPRHHRGIHVIFASGRAGFIKSSEAQLTRRGTDILGSWSPD